MTGYAPPGAQMSLTVVAGRSLFGTPGNGGQSRGYSEGDWAVKLELRHHRRRRHSTTLGSRGFEHSLERAGERWNVAASEIPGDDDRGRSWGVCWLLSAD